ncbi:MAG: hypothetical protein COB20_00410 [SAR86 cluster bacterium]|uniref:Endonuclease n=1 Tax=SAR86 cluster bacterium TaxID=2030880 RepID=A0A2A4XIJ1_9GAMM|nr:MAG: hypothetical protein COB20_00410 [SAR86 cluster bacterium]
MSSQTFSEVSSLLLKCTKQAEIVIQLGHPAFSAGVLSLFRRVVLAVVLIVSMSQSQSVELRIAHCLHGCPVGGSTENHLILRPIYALSYSTRNKAADWAAYRVTSGSIGIASSLSREALVDDFVEETLSAADFINAEESGLTRARFVPLVNFAGTPYWNEVNYMSNAVARSRNLSQGAWYGLEWSIRNWVNRENEVYVLTGPIFRETPVTASLETQTQHRVPDAFFKIVVSPDNRATAFIFDQDLPVHVHHCDNRASIDEIEKATGLEFFPENPRLVLGSMDTSLGCF